MRRHPLDKTILQVRRALDVAAAVYLEDFLRDLLGGRTVNAALTNMPSIDGYLRRALEDGWLLAWRTTSLELQALVRRNSRRWKRYDLQQHALEQFAPTPGPAPAAAEEWPVPVPVPPLRLPQPIVLPAVWREYDPNETRTTAEWLADHEASVSQFIPREYVDKYLQQRLPPLKQLTEQVMTDSLRQSAGDAAAAIAERGFGVRESIQALRPLFSQHADWQLERIARTEGATLYEVGRMARYREDPLVQGWRFNAILDSRLCDVCEFYDGKEFDAEEGEYSPPLHPDCRCTLDPILFDETPSFTTLEPDDPRPAEGFGRPDYGVLPPNAGQGQLPF